jgi:leucyl aminopeptidase (aminopeptidase T)
MSVLKSMKAEAVLAIMTQREIAGHEPPPAVAAAMKNVDTVIQVCEKASITHTTATKEAIAAGVRWVNMLDIPVDDIRKGVSVPDISLIKERTEKLAEMLTKANVVKITTPWGTNITLSLAGREALPLHPMGPKHFPIPYYGEAAISPVEGSAEGTMVFDLAMRGWGFMLKEPLRCMVKEGKVVDISGASPDVEKLRKIAARDENAANIAELGIGTSHIIPGTMQGASRDFARLNTVHLALGRNDDIGGKTWSNIHQDGLMSRATVELDQIFVLRDGAFLI